MGGIAGALLAACTVTREGRPAVELIPGAWRGFAARFIDADGRVRRPQNADDTVSEGQAYALLMALVLDDRPTFDRVLDWTERHLSRAARFGDHLLAWHWRPGRGVADWNSAADADVDYALALVLAHRRWGDEAYLRRATAVLADILRVETEVVAGRRYLVPGNWRSPGPARVLNPSYFSPAHFRVFFEVTGDARWRELVDGTYHALLAVSRGLEGQRGVGLVPDWLAVAPDGAFAFAEGFSRRVAWDAIRIPWRVGLDALWFEEPRARDHLERLHVFYAGEWERHGGRFFAEYAYDGTPVGRYESAAVYAMTLGIFTALRSPLLPRVLDKIATAYDPGGQYVQDPGDYYQNALTLLGLLLLRHASAPPPGIVPGA